MLDAKVPLLTPDLPGIGGQLKQVPEDFVVEEIPAYEPIGSGEHCFLWVEKRDMSAEDLVAHVARTLELRRADVGVAGLKDRQAVTRQFLSVPASADGRLDQLETDGLRVLRTARHTNKLKTGHLVGNRFTIRLRNVDDDAENRAVAIAERLRCMGVPNAYGEQRFGAGRSNWDLGYALLRKEKSTRSIPYSRRSFLLRLSLSSVQSGLFNAYLKRRMEDGLIQRALEGDVMQVVASGGPFVVEDVEREQPRLDRREIVTTGPLFGPKMKSPTHSALEREAQVLDAAGLERRSFEQFRKLTRGARRPLLNWVPDLDVSMEPQGACIRFSLPSGAYATTLIEEFRKSGESVAPSF